MVRRVHRPWAAIDALSPAAVKPSTCAPKARPAAMSDTVPPIAAGLAFGAHVLGFTTAGETASIAAHGRWTRLSTSRGHVLVR